MVIPALASCSSFILRRLIETSASPEPEITSSIEYMGKGERHKLCLAQSWRIMHECAALRSAGTLLTRSGVGHPGPLSPVENHSTKGNSNQGSTSHQDSALDARCRRIEAWRAPCGWGCCVTTAVRWDSTMEHITTLLVYIDIDGGHLQMSWESERNGNAVYAPLLLAKKPLGTVINHRAPPDTRFFSYLFLLGTTPAYRLHNPCSITRTYTSKCFTFPFRLQYSCSLYLQS